MEEPDKIEEHMPKGCEGCPEYWSCQEVAKRGEMRYEIDIEIKPIVTAHKKLMIACPRTGNEMAGEFPEGIRGTVQYGVNLETLAVTLNTVGMMSIERTHEVLSDMFGVPISTGTITEMVKNCAIAVNETVEEIKGAIIEAPLAHFDETGSRVEGKIGWAHVASTEELTYISMEEKRGQKGMDNAGILPNFKGTGIHDCYVSRAA
jgi:transposase